MGEDQGRLDVCWSSVSVRQVLSLPSWFEIKNKKSQHRSWHTAKCNELYHLKWNINAWHTAIACTSAILYSLLEFVIRFVSNFYTWCPVSLRTIQWTTRSLYINKWLMYSQFWCFTAAILSAILEFVMKFASNVYNWCSLSFPTIPWNTVSILINGWVTANYSVSRPLLWRSSWNL